MRHIEFVEFKPPRKWRKTAENVTAALKAEAAKGKTGRNAFIDNRARIWQGLKRNLEALSHGKCWFSEARETVSHMHVEHFRPKKKVVEIDGSKRELDGYWWLAFDWTNFRVSGQIPNCKKGNYFPLRNESRRATFARPATADEDHLFLDPTKRQDVLLVTFAPDGSMQPRPKVTAWQEKRVQETAKYFGLNDFPNLTDARRQIWQDCQLLLDGVFTNLRKSDECGGSPALDAVAEEKLEALRKMVRKDAPFSSVAMACIEGNAPDLLKVLV